MSTARELLEMAAKATRRAIVRAAAQMRRAL